MHGSDGVKTKIRELRKQNKLSQEELAEMVGVSKPYISNIECAKHSISLVNAYKLAKALDISIEKLLIFRD